MKREGVSEFEDQSARDSSTSFRRLPVVGIGFVGLLLVMGALVVDSTHEWRSVNLDGIRLRKEYRDRDGLLDALRTNIYHATTLLRDYILSPQDAANSNLEAALADIRNENDALCDQYATLVLPEERQGVETLRHRTDVYMESLQTAARERGRHQRMQTFLRENILAGRSELLALIAQVNALDERDMAVGEERVQTLHQRFQRRVTSLSFLALVLSTILAAAVLLHLRHLERRDARHIDEVTAARQDLRSLSHRLVTAQEEERRNLSRELHDEVGQSMTAILMDLGRLESRLSSPSACREILSSVRRAVEQNVARVRDLSLLLRPSMLDELGLIPALHWQVREVGRRTGLRVTLIADELDERLPDSCRTGVYRIVQEALHNCAKHSHATEVRVVIQRDDGALSVSVQDNGVGFDPGKERGLGLLGIEERVMRLGGIFGIESHLNSGTVLSVRIPMPRPAEKLRTEGVA